MVVRARIGGLRLSPNPPYIYPRSVYATFTLALDEIVASGPAGDPRLALKPRR